MKFNVSVFSGEDQLMEIADTLGEAEEIHFIDFDEDDAGIFMRMIRQATGN